MTDPITVWHGDSLDLLRDIASESVDSVCTDPPYGLEFMGKDWDKFGRQDVRQRGDDTFTSGNRRHGLVRHGIGASYGKDTLDAMRAFQEWCQLWAAECLRVLKPGGHLLAFGGTRTAHRLACAIEDAGFEIRDGKVWIYGCLTDDVDVLTPTGWRRGIDLAVGDQVAQWNPETGSVTTATVRRTYRAPWDGDLVRFRNTDTDQALTPNHQVWHRNLDHRGADGETWHEWSEYRAKDAATLSRRTPLRLPLAGEHSGGGIGGVDYATLLGWVWTEGGFDLTGTGVRIYQSSVNQDKCDEIAALMDRMGPHKRYDYARTYTRRNGRRHDYTAVTWYFSGDLARQVRADLPDKHPTYSLLWRMTLDEKLEFLAAALAGDGSQGAGGSWQFYQSDAEDREWFVTLLALVGWRGHDTNRRPPRTGGSVSVSVRADTTLSPTALRAAAVHYRGDVWCVQVPTGAFVARRNGHVFITGNSGFPKSLNVGKAIDLQACRQAGTHSDSPAHACPLAPEADPWRGFGTAAKPAHEPIVVARKPLAGTVAQNVQAWGTGALNIDATRIGANDYLARSAGGWQPDGYVGGTSRTYDNSANVSTAGRWPPNVLLDDAAAAELDRQSGESVSRSGGASGTHPGPMDWGKPDSDTPRGGHDDAGGASRFFPVFRYEPKAPTSERPRIRRDGASEGMLAGKKVRECNVCGSRTNPAGGAASGRPYPTCGHDDWSLVETLAKPEHVAHATVKPLDLMRWLVRLVTPPGGLVLDPFAGSGTTAEACLLEGFRCITIEREAEYLPLIRQRLDRRRDPVAYLAGTRAADEQPDLFGGAL